MITHFYIIMYRASERAVVSCLGGVSVKKTTENKYSILSLLARDIRGIYGDYM